MDWQKIVDFGSKLTLAGLLLLILVTGQMGFWTYGSTYKDMVSDRDQWKSIALRGTNIAVAASNNLPSEGVKLGAQPPVSPKANKEEVTNVLDHIDDVLKPYDNE